MARACLICTHPSRVVIEAAHAAGTANRRIAADYGIAEASVRRHFASHVTQEY